MPALLGVADGFDLRVGQTRAPMPALADDFPALNQNGADQGIGRSPSISAARQAQGQTNEFMVGEHYLVNSKVSRWPVMRTAVTSGGGVLFSFI